MESNITWILKKFKIKDLKDNPKNPRRMSKHQALQLNASIEKFGLIDKPICTPSGNLIGGHQRKNILMKRGMKEVECWIPNRELTEKELNELTVRLNRNLGEWDWDILANEWETEDLLEAGFEPEELCFDEGATEVENGEEPQEKKKKVTVCPSCGHEF